VKVKVKTIPTRITLTEPEREYLQNIRKAGSFRSDSQTIGEALRFVQTLRDTPDIITTLKVLGPRFGISMREENGDRS